MRSWHERIYHALLRLFPSEFRGDFADDMTADFRDQSDEAASGGGRRPVVRLWARTAVALLRRAPHEHLDVLRRDAGYALRLLRRRPAFAASALLTLAIGIGLNTAVFSVVYGVLWRSLPFPDSDRLVRLFEVRPAPSYEPTSVSSANFLDWKAQARTLDGVVLIGQAQLTLVADGPPEQIRAMTVTEDFFRILGARPLLGRVFIAADLEPLAAHFQRTGKQRPSLPRPQVVILGHDLWQRQFHGRSDVIGQTIRLDGQGVEVIGVMGPDFGFTEVLGQGRADSWIPGGADPVQRRARYLSAVGRLAPGVSVTAAQAELDVIASRLSAAHPKDNPGWGVRVSPLLDTVTAAVSTQLWFLFGAAACVLLIACANVANLLLAHASGRRLELATRVALGASRAHLVRQTLTEGLLLAGIGGAAGCVLAFSAVPALVAMAPPEIPRLNEIAVDGRVVAFTAAISAVVGIGCGLAACLSIDRVNPKSTLRPSGADTGSHGRRFRQGLTVAEIALALMLVVAAGLLVRTVRVLAALDLGFNPTNVISVGLSPDYRKYERARIVEFELELMGRLKELPGVVAAGIGSRPLGGGGGSTLFRLPGNDGEGLRIGVDAVSPGYFEALGVPLRQGRLVQDRDTAQAPPVAILNESAARVLWSREDAVGRTVVMDDVQLQIVGVIGDVRRDGLEAAPAPAVYLPHVQSRSFSMNNVLIRTERDPRQILAGVRTVMQQLDPDQALVRIQTLEERLAVSMAPRRFILRLIGLFSVLALGLAMLGVYGVIAESVAQRVPEIGIRMALGATANDVMKMILYQGSGMVVAGIALGIVGAIALNDAMASLVFGVPTTDPAAYVVACACLAAATLGACTIPARRAAAVDPVMALRQE